MANFVKVILIIALFSANEARDSRKIYNTSNSAFRIRFHRNNEDRHCTIISSEDVLKFRGFDSNSQDALHISRKAALQPLADTKLAQNDNSEIFEIYGRKKSVVEAHMDVLCQTIRNPVENSIFGEDEDSEGEATPEIVKLIDSGDQKNRIDVVLMGDGYKAAERTRFFEDIDRLTHEMFEGVTFRSYLPLFNIWAIHVPSVQSGIGYNGPKNTPFGLYREKGQLRGIFPGNVPKARRTCRLVGSSGCDYPSLIGNDDYYGGLGGEFVISTRSNRSGTVVLRHEMGHNFVDVGEEYDNGQVYWGVNAARSLNSIGWRHWLTKPAREEKAIYRLLEYPWSDLSKGSRTFTFNSDGTHSSWYLLATVSAAGEEDCLEFLLDGEVLPWTTTGYDDREFYTWHGTEGFSKGKHTFTVRSKTPSTNNEIPRMICSVTLHEYGSEDEFVESNDHISAYPTWDHKRRKTYRPTNEGCLMRNMTQTSLCNVCREGMWYQFLQRVSLIDNVVINEEASEDGTKRVSLNTLQLGQLRQSGNEVEGEELIVRWHRNFKEMSEFKDQFQISAEPGTWTVRVEFITPEVKFDPLGLLKDTLLFTVR